MSWLGDAGIKALLAPSGLNYDLKCILPPEASHARIHARILGQYFPIPAIHPCLCGRCPRT